MDYKKLWFLSFIHTIALFYFLMQAPLPAYAAIDRSILERRDFIYGTQIGAWEMDGGSAVNNSVCKNLISDAAVKSTRWGTWDTFTSMGGTMSDLQFNTGIDGIIATGAVPILELPPLYDEQCIGGTKPWSLAWIKNIIQKAGSRTVLYEFGNEPDNYCGWDTDLPGDGQYATNWIANVPAMKKYARSLGFEIFVGGPSRANLNHTTAALTNNFLQAVLNEYNNPISQYYHDSDVLPDFISAHAYFPDCSIAWNCTDITQFPSRFDLAIDDMHSQSAYQDTVTLTGRDLPLAITEWNFTASDSGDTETLDDDQTTMDKYIGGMLKMFRIKNIWLANKFTFSSHNGTAMDMVTNSCVAKPAYNAFKAISLQDAATSYAAPTVAATYQATILGDGAINYWRLGESSGTTAQDAAGSHNGTYINTPQLGQTGALLGNADTATNFTGADSEYVSIPYHASINPNTFSVETWVYPTGGSGYRAIAASRSYPLGWVLYQTDTNHWAFWINDGGGGGGMVALESGAIALNTWTHLVASYDGTTARLYVNGDEITARGVAYSPSTSSIFSIGQGTPGDNFFFTGKIDELALYDKALTDTQIENHYTQATVAAATPTPTQTPTPTSVSSSSPQSSSTNASQETKPFKCSALAPQSAPDLFQIDVNDTNAILYYSPAAGSVDKYAINYGYWLDDNRFAVEYSQAPSTGVHTYTIHALEPNKKYSFRIQGKNNCTGGNWSSNLSITTAKKGSKSGIHYYKNSPLQFFMPLLSSVESIFR